MSGDLQDQLLLNLAAGFVRQHDRSNILRIVVTNQSITLRGDGSLWRTVRSLWSKLPELVTHPDRRHSGWTLAGGEVIEAGGPLAFNRWYGPLQKMSRNEPRLDAPIRDVMSLKRWRKRYVRWLS